MAAATNNLLLTTYELDEGCLNLAVLADAVANMTPVADGATTNTFRFTWNSKVFILLTNTHSAEVTFTIAGDSDVDIPGYGEQDMADLTAVLAIGSVNPQYGILSCPSGYADSGIVSVAVTYADDASDGTILAGAFKLKT